MEETERKTEAEVETAFDPNRRLCPDGACVGVIGSDDRCTVCARSEHGAAEVADAPAAGPEEGAAAASGGFDPARRLCDDGSCVGVVGADGICGTCGRKAD